jgi:hypothetical protein
LIQQFFTQSETETKSQYIAILFVLKPLSFSCRQDQTRLAHDIEDGATHKTQATGEVIDGIMDASAAFPGSARQAAALLPQTHTSLVRPIEPAARLAAFPFRLR